jgi:8-oxo-dGTP diphosphatase
MPVPISPEFAKYERPAVAVDVILFTIRQNELQIGLVKREEEPFKGTFALPGRFVRYDEGIEETAKKALSLKGGIDPQSVVLTQLYTFGQDMERDTRIRTISIVYFGIVQAHALSEQKTNKFSWHSVYDLPTLAFDHRKVIDYAVERLRNKILWDTYAFNFLDEEFTLTQLQKVHEIILNKPLDKRNFRKKVFEQYSLIDTKKKFQEGVHRPAALYRLK